MKDNWLLLTDYASKYRISVSTLRRRIKAGQQEHRFEGGRYYLPDEMPPASVMIAEPAPPETHFPTQAAAQPFTHEPIPILPTPVAQTPAAHTGAEEPLITTTSRLLNELKQAYTLILHEKEELIILLKEEIADLKTLVRVLESENARLTERRDFKEDGPVGTA